jgi:hypothetical protein
MFWGIGPDDWMQLWSGAIGSFVAAVIGGAVALLVVVATNRHSSKLARDGRVKAALADIAATALLVESAGMNGSRKEVESTILQMTSAIVRLRLEIDHKGLAKELWVWPWQLGALANKLVEARDDDKPSEEVLATYDELGNAASVLQGMALAWLSIPRERRDDAVAALIRAREASENGKEPVLDFDGLYAVRKGVGWWASIEKPKTRKDWVPFVSLALRLTLLVIVVWLLDPTITNPWESTPRQSAALLTGGAGIVAVLTSVPQLKLKNAARRVRGAYLVLAAAAGSLILGAVFIGGAGFSEWGVWVVPILANLFGVADWQAKLWLDPPDMAPDGATTSVGSAEPLVTQNSRGALTDGPVR